MDGYDSITGELVQNVRFFTQYLRPVKDSAEVLPTKTNVERAYIPPEAQIREMMASGELLRQARMARFAPDDLVDVAPEVGADLVDVQRMAEEVTARLKSQGEAADAARAKEEAEQLKLKFDAAVAAEVARRAAAGPSEA